MHGPALVLAHQKDTLIIPGSGQNQIIDATEAGRVKEFQVLDAARAITQGNESEPLRAACQEDVPAHFRNCGAGQQAFPCDPRALGRRRFIEH